MAAQSETLFGTFERGTEKPGMTAILRAVDHPILTTTSTLYQQFSASAAEHASEPFVGSRRWDWAKGDFTDAYDWITYAQTDELRTALGSALGQLAQQGRLGTGVDARSKDWCCSFWALNRPEFQVVLQAANAYSRRLVCIYDTYDAANASYIIDHSESRVLFTTSSHLHQVIEKRAEMPMLKVIVLLDLIAPAPASTGSAAPANPLKLPPGQVRIDQMAAQYLAEKGLELLGWQDLIALGRQHTLPHAPALGKEDIVMLCYTSGTTGKPKGALIRSSGMAWAADSLLVNGEGMSTLIGYLPIAHIFECLVEAAVIAGGGRIGYSCGDPLRLIEDMQILKPSLFPAVPRVLNRIAALIQEQMAGDTFKAKLLRRAVESKLAYHDIDGRFTHAFWDRIVFKKVKAVLGGNVTNIGAGSAPLRPDVIRLLRVALCVDLRNGYGQTENGGVCTAMREMDKDPHSVGPPQPGVEVRLRDCPQLGYHVTDKPWPRGELLMRGGNTFAGYFKEPAKTRETIDEDGWLYSGDVAAIDEKGRIHIIDRVKNLVKLSQGEYVALERVEQEYSGLPFLAQIWVYGDSTQDYLIAVAVPEAEPFARFASKVLGRSVSASDVAAACKEPKVVEAVLRELVKLGKSRALNGIEMLRGLHLTPELFSLENGLLTPTMKTKRPEAAAYFKKQIQELYERGPVDIRSFA